MRGKIEDSWTVIQTLRVTEQVLNACWDKEKEELLVSQGVVYGIIDDVEAVSRTVNHSNVQFTDQKTFEQSLYQLSHFFDDLRHEYKKVRGYTVVIPFSHKRWEELNGLLQSIESSLRSTG